MGHPDAQPHRTTRTAALTLAHELAELADRNVPGVTRTSFPTLTDHEASFLMSWFDQKRFFVTVREYDAGTALREEGAKPAGDCRRTVGAYAAATEAELGSSGTHPGMRSRSAGPMPE